MTFNRDNTIKKDAIIQSPAALPSFEALSLGEVMQAFLLQLDCKESSRRLYARTLPLFFKWVVRTGRHLDRITKADIIVYRDGLLDGSGSIDGKALSGLTVGAYLVAVKVFYRWLEEVGAYRNVAKDVHLPERLPKFEREPLTAEQARMLTEEAEQTGSLRDRAILCLLLRCGLRTVEVARADVSDIVLRDGVMTLSVQGKGHISKNNFVVLSKKCENSVKAYLATRNDIEGRSAEELRGIPLFLSNSRSAPAGRLTTRSISAIAKTHLRAIGLNSRAYTAHSLRHTFGCLSLDLYGDVYDVQLQMRHASANTTRFYVYHRDEQRRIELAKKHSIDNII